MQVLCVFLLFVPAAFAVNCHLNGDGVYDMGCRAFVTCTNGLGVVTECKSNYVYNEVTKHCADPTTFTSLCSKLMDCSSKKDGKYADITNNCKSYYTCMGGTFFGHNYCIGGTVFNEALQICDWPVDTAPPCGTA